MNLALFDLDHTLLPLDSDHEFGEFLIRHELADGVTYRARNNAFYEQYCNGTLVLDEYIAFTTSIWRELDAEAQSALQQTFMEEVILPAIHPQAVELVERHRAQGDLLAIVTATNEFVTRPIVQALGIADLIAVQLQRDSQGWFTGEIEGTPSMREGKVQRLQQWLAAQGLSWADVNTTFYSDSRNDIPLLERVNHPVATNPDDTLRAVALEKGWPILELFPQQ